MYIKQEEKQQNAWRGARHFSVFPDSSGYLCTMFNTPKTQVHPQTPCFDHKTLDAIPSHPIVIVFLVNNSLQNAKEKFEVKDFERKY
jgi:hypothetical protein